MLIISLIAVALIFALLVVNRFVEIHKDYKAYQESLKPNTPKGEFRVGK